MDNKKLWKGYIYICNFDNGMVKIGSDDVSPLIVINKYFRCKNSLNGDGTLTEFWIRGPYSSYKEYEQALVEKIGDNMLCPHYKVCTGVNYLELVAFAESLLAKLEV